jgi:type VI secretion system protein ImpD
MSFWACHGTPWAAFYATPSLQRPQGFADPDATANAKLSAMMQYVLCTSRIAHYLKMMCRDRVGSFDSPADIERVIGGWLFQLSVASDEADAESQAKYPLADTSVTVNEVPGKPGTYSSVIHLRPHFQLDQMSSSIRLTTEIVAAK